MDSVQQAARDQFEKQRARYGKTHILADTSDVAEALDAAGIFPPGEALDVATGGGHTALLLAARGFQVTAADLSPGMLEAARTLTEEEGYSLTTVCHEAEKYPYADARFDLVTCRVAAHHFSDPVAFLRESARVLKPGGSFLLIDGSVPDGEVEAAEWIHRVEKLRDSSHARFLSPGTWSHLCEDAGMTVRHCQTTPLKQPDLTWYFDTAGTSPENQAMVADLVRRAPESARRVFSLGEEDGRIFWWWPRLSLIAQRSQSR